MTDYTYEDWAILNGGLNTEFPTDTFPVTVEEANAELQLDADDWAWFDSQALADEIQAFQEFADWLYDHLESTFDSDMEQQFAEM